MPFKIKGKWAWVLFVLLGMLIYSNTFSVPIHYDGVSFIKENDAIRNIWDLKAIWLYWPNRFIPILTFAFNYSLHKLQLFGYHLINLMIHLGATLCVWWLARLILVTPAMVKSKLRQHADSLSLFAGLIFLTHPIQTQSVTYIYQRCTSLVSLFYLLSLCCYFKSRGLQTERACASRGQRWYILAMIFAIAAMLTKENAITLPLAIILCEVMFFKEQKSIKWKSLIPFLFLLPIVPFLVFLTKTQSSLDVQRFLSLPIARKCYFLTQFRVLVTYLRLMLFPFRQNFEYDYPVSTRFLEPSTMGSFLFLMALVLCAIWLYRNHRLLSFAIFWFFVTLSAESSFIPLKDVIFEHRLYLPMVGFAFFMAAGIISFSENKTFKLGRLLLACLVAGYCFLTYQRNKVWASEMTLWSDVVSKSPQRETAYNNRGIAYEEEGNWKQALLDYNKSIELNPKFVLAYCNRASIYLKMGDLSQAISDYSTAIALRPTYARGYNNRGIAYQTQGDLDQSIEDFNKAIALRPRFAEAYNNRAVTYVAQGKLDEAIFDYTQAIAINVDYAEAYCNRGGVFLNKGDLDQAIEDFNKAISLRPRFAKAYNNRGIAFQRKGNIPQAILEYSKAIESRPDFAEAFNNRGAAYAQQGDPTQAILDYRKALELRPGYKEARENLELIFPEIDTP